MSIFRAIEESVEADRQLGALETALARWRGRHLNLRAATDIQSLATLCRSGERGHKDAALAALCCEAACGDDRARLLLAWLFTPALVRSARSLRATTSLEQEDLHSEMMLGFWSEVRRICPGACNVDGRLLNRARWRAREASLKALGHESHETPVARQPEAPEPDDWCSQAELRADGWFDLEPAEVVARAVVQGVISAQDSEILTADRRRTPLLCAEWGITLVALQSRRRRIRARLGTWLREQLPDIAQ